MRRFPFLFLSLFAISPALSAEFAPQLRPSIVPPVADREPPLGLSAGPVIGTTGLGAEVGLRPPQSLVGARLQVTGLAHETSVDAGGTRFHASAESVAATVIGDWHFSGSGWRVAFGLRMGGLEATLRNADPVTVSLGGRTYTAAQAGGITGRAKWHGVLPQLTLGYVHRFDGDSPWSFSIDGGAVFLRSPKVALEASGPLRNDPGFRADLEAERADLKTRLSSIRALPVLAFGVQYRF